MSLTVTLWTAAVALVIGLFCAWRGSQPVRPFGKPRLAPWSLLMAVAAAIVLFAVVHLLNLMGLHTGRN